MVAENPEIQPKLFEQPPPDELYRDNRDDIERFYGVPNPLSDYGGGSVLPSEDKIVPVAPSNTNYQPSLFDEEPTVIDIARQTAAEVAARAAEHRIRAQPITHDQLMRAAKARRKAAGTVRASGVI